ncbi:alpha/beta fold hydrolase [Rhodococcoides kyotonense]|uniref:Thioesterase domain-containing protein n=1 Tax=Rhodococcoides kyotonense TaxID=398843 RepID=A0A239M7V7_9NOCA|nr:alpha/beta hydrolase [Rhodococcus kyotonensis]SNT37929.1 Thioesterase domain-containing protein [Rhodococcus kyotonensis]
MGTFVLIPGAGGDGRYWNRVAAELTSRGNDVVAVTLPAGGDAGLSDYADVVVAAIGERTRVVLVAQSFGGFTAPLVALRADVALIVLLNAMTPKPGEAAEQWWAATGFEQARAEQALRDGRDLATEDLLADAFFHDVPADVASEMLSGEATGESDVPFTMPWPLDAWPDVPTRVLHGTEDRFIPIEFQRRVVGERLGLDVDAMPGGHLLALSQPVELANRLEAYAR